MKLEYGTKSQEFDASGTSVCYKGHVKSIADGAIRTYLATS